MRIVWLQVRQDREDIVESDFGMPTRGRGHEDIGSDMGTDIRTPCGSVDLHWDLYKDMGSGD